MDRPGFQLMAFLLFQVLFMMSVVEAELLHPRFLATSNASSVPNHARGYCSMYDLCGQRSDGKVLNCPYSVPAVKPDDLLSSKIQSLCPTISGNVCCTTEQFHTLRGQVQQAIPFLVGCPACLRNFLNLFCELSCSPNQSLFINVTYVSKVNNTLTVLGIDYFLTESFAQELFNSCKDVKFGTMNTKAMDFIGAGAQTYEEVFPYSVFYIFFEQYLTIWRTALINICIALGAVFIVCVVITSSLWSSAIILLVLAMIVLDLMGIMGLLNIQLNAISVVNLVMSVGIAVEFCVHITHAFVLSGGDKLQRMQEALRTMGASVFSGITLTKLVGVLVLRFAHSEIFVVYYFQMFLALVLVGFLHGLVFLPVLLSICGPPSREKVIESSPETSASSSS